MCTLENGIFNSIPQYSLVSVSHFDWLGIKNWTTKVRGKKAGVSEINSILYCYQGICILHLSVNKSCVLFFFVFFFLIMISGNQLQCSSGERIHNWTVLDHKNLWDDQPLIGKYYQGIVFSLLHPFTLFPSHHTYFQYHFSFYILHAIIYSITA